MFIFELVNNYLLYWYIWDKNHDFVNLCDYCDMCVLWFPMLFFIKTSAYACGGDAKLTLLFVIGICLVSSLWCLSFGSQFLEMFLMVCSTDKFKDKLQGKKSQP